MDWRRLRICAVARVSGEVRERVPCTEESRRGAAAGRPRATRDSSDMAHRAVARCRRCVAVSDSSRLLQNLARFHTLYAPRRRITRPIDPPARPGAAAETASDGHGDRPAEIRDEKLNFRKFKIAVDMVKFGKSTRAPN